MTEPTATDVLAEILAERAGHIERFKRERDEVPLSECRGIFDRAIEAADAFLRCLLRDGFAVYPVAGVGGESGKPFLRQADGGTMGFAENPTRDPNYRTPKYWGPNVFGQTGSKTNNAHPHQPEA